MYTYLCSVSAVHLSTYLLFLHTCCSFKPWRLLLIQCSCLSVLFFCLSKDLTVRQLLDGHIVTMHSSCRPIGFFHSLYSYGFVIFVNTNNFCLISNWYRTVHISKDLIYCSLWEAFSFYHNDWWFSTDHFRVERACMKIKSYPKKKKKKKYCWMERWLVAIVVDFLKYDIVCSPFVLLSLLSM